MRPGQKNRMRGGRGGNNNNSAGGGSRRGPNPLTRSYESNGPDVKVRGTPQHIAEKYVQLARDAHTAGDIVMAESYLQHAEHYYRIISAAHNAQQVAYNQSMGIQNTGQDDVQDNEDEFEVVGADRFTFQAPQVFQPPGQSPASGAGQGAYPQAFGDSAQNGEQPSIGDMPMTDGGQSGYQPNQQPRGDRSFGNRRPFGDRGERPERQDRPERSERQERPDRPERTEQQADRPDRGERGPRRFGRDRPFGDRSFNDRNNADRGNGEPRFQGERAPSDRLAERGSYVPRQNEPASDPAVEPQPVLPSFITAPVRVMAPESASPAPVVAEPELKVRRRRRVRNAEGELVESED